MMMDENDESDFKGKGPPGQRRATRNESEKKRRDKLNVYISELSSMVPTCNASKKKLDKTSILKMTVNYMKMHNDLTGSVLGQEYGLHLSFLTSDEIGNLMDESLNSFLFALSSSWEIVFASKSFTPVLGLEWEQVQSSNFMDLIHPDDRDTVINELNDDNESVYFASDSNGIHKIPRKPNRHIFDVRIACAPSNQRVENADPYEKVHVVGYTGTWEGTNDDTTEDIHVKVNSNELVPREGPLSFKAKPLYFVAVGLLSRPAVQRFANIDKSIAMEFESRHTMDGKFLFVDPRSTTMTGFWPYELLGTSIYNYIHHDDLHMLASVHQSLLEYGECKTEPFRMRSKGHQWIWMKSRSFISYNHWNSKPEFFCSTNVAVCNRQEMQIQEYSTRQLQGSSGVNNLYPASTTLPLLSNQSLQEILPADHTMNDQNEKEFVPFNSNLDVFSSNSSVASSVIRSESCDDSVHRQEEDTDSVDSVDLSMSFEELESFIEAQRQLHDQLMMKHTSLEDAIVKQKQQLRAVQQQMLLNLQAQLTIDPSKNHDVLEEQLRKAKQVSELQEKQENRQKELVKTLKETRRKVEKHNKRQLKLYREKRPQEQNSRSYSSGATTSSVPSTSNQWSTASFKNNQLAPPSTLQLSTAKQLQTKTHERVLVTSNQATDSHRFAGQAFNPQQGHLTHLAPPPLVGVRDPRATTSQSSVSRAQTSEPQQSPTTLNNIQNLLTASSQNPQAMQKLLSGLSSQPDVAQTLLNLLKQAQSSESSEQDAWLFNQSLQQTTNQFSAALNTGVAKRSAGNQMQYQSGFSVESLQQVQQQAQRHQQQQQHQHLQQQQRPLQQQQQRMSNVRVANQKMMFTSRRQKCLSTEHSTVTWTSTETPTDRNLQQMSNVSPLTDSPTLLSPPTKQFANSNNNNEAQKETPKQKDYFSNFTSKELEAMFVTASSQQNHAHPSTSAEASTSSCSVEENKLREEEAFGSPLLVNQQNLMQMHEDQRKQLLIRQQEQLLMSFQQSKPAQQTSNEQTMFNPFNQHNQLQDSSPPPFLSNARPSTSTEGSHPSTDTTPTPTAWDSGTNFELNDADEVVLNMLLTQPSMDSLLDPSPWPETDSLLDYLNMNPDLTSD